MGKDFICGVNLLGNKGLNIRQPNKKPILVLMFIQPSQHIYSGRYLNSNNQMKQKTQVACGYWHLKDEWSNNLRHISAFVNDQLSVMYSITRKCTGNWTVWSYEKEDRELFGLCLVFLLLADIRRKTDDRCILFRTLLSTNCQSLLSCNRTD